MEPHELDRAIGKRRVRQRCPACRKKSDWAGVMKTSLGDPGGGAQNFVGGYCANCGFLRLFHVGTLESED